MKSIIITSWREAGTIGKAIEAFWPQMNDDDEMLVACPDYETRAVIERYAAKDIRIKYVQDPGNGKPAALNLLFSQASGDIFILSDGDVYVDKNAVKNVLKPFADENVGAVCGRTIATDDKSKMLGFWAHLLNDVADEQRIERAGEGKFIFCSGYLFAIKAHIAKTIIIPEDVLDDAYISIQVWKAGYKIAYAPNATVYIKNPATLRDWIKQKRRNASGHKVLNNDGGEAVMKSFSGESSGILSVLRYPEGVTQTIYTGLLIPFRLWIWILAFIDDKTNKTSKDLWKRVESTK